MPIRKVEVSNFRGIKSLDWTVQSSFVCLIGAGDSCKTTILDAIERALWPNWTTAFSDADFYNFDTSKPINVTLHISPVPLALSTDKAFGLHLRGWDDATGEIHDEPVEGDELCISIRLTVGADLDPQWHVITDRSLEPPRIGHTNRSRIVATRVGDNPDIHFSLGRYSALTRLAASTDDAKAVLADLSRHLRTSLASVAVGDLDSVLDAAHRQIASFGGQVERGEMKVLLDPTHSAAGPNALSLHSGDVPFRLYGLGTRKLMSLGIQSLLLAEGGMLLVDEVEQGLEPYRLRSLLRQIRDAVAGGRDSASQVFLTSHSGTVVAEVGAQNVHITRNNDGIVDVQQAPGNLQATIRKHPDALLAQKVVVCEGKTEEGICRALDSSWPLSSGESLAEPLAHRGVAIVDGGGIPQAAARASDLSELGYSVLLFCDSDKEIEKPTVDELRASGVRVVQWSQGVSTEERIAEDLSWDGFASVLSYIEEQDSVDLLTDLGDALGVEDTSTLETLADLEDYCDRGSIRDAFGATAKKKDWLKRIDHGMHVGETIRDDWMSIATTDLANKLAFVGEWADG